MKKLVRIALYSVTLPMMLFSLYTFFTASDTPNPETISWMAMALIFIPFSAILMYEMAEKGMLLLKMQRMIDHSFHEVAYAQVVKDSVELYYAFWIETSRKNGCVPKLKEGDERHLRFPLSPNEMHDGARVFRAVGPYIGRLGKQYVTVLNEEFVLD